MPILLILTTGGAPAPLAASICRHRPDRALFIVSPQTRGTADEVLRLATVEGAALGPGQVDHAVVRDAQDLEGCAVEIAALLRREVTGWRERGGDYRVIVDFTGGTKAMSAAAAVASLRWPCEYSYVGGQERDRGGVGIVVSGKEEVVHAASPVRLEALLELDRYVTLFNQGDYGAAESLARGLHPRLETEERSVWRALEGLAHAYAAWDRFEYGDAASRLDGVLAQQAPLRERIGPVALFGPDGTLARHRSGLAALRTEACPELVWDLLANASRCAARCRWDDAVARLYRAVEAAAQARLREGYGIETGRIDPESLPEAVRTDPDLTRPSAGGEERVQWALAQAYRALARLNDPLGLRFAASLLFDPQKSPLQARNHSLLAHGFQPVGERGYLALRREADALLQLQDEFVEFPRLAPW